MQIGTEVVRISPGPEGKGRKLQPGRCICVRHAGNIIRQLFFVVLALLFCGNFHTMAVYPRSESNGLRKCPIDAVIRSLDESSASETDSGSNTRRCLGHRQSRVGHANENDFQSKMLCDRRQQRHLHARVELQTSMHVYARKWLYDDTPAEHPGPMQSIVVFLLLLRLRGGSEDVMSSLQTVHQRKEDDRQEKIVAIASQEVAVGRIMTQCLLRRCIPGASTYTCMHALHKSKTAGDDYPRK